MAELKLIGITKKYNKDTAAVEQLDLTVKDGEAIAIVGPSGCGKSTLLRMIAGLENLDDGVIFVDGEQINSISPQNRDIAMVFQQFALYDTMTCFDNIAFPLKMKKVKPAEIQQRVSEIAEMLGISDLLYRKPRELSGGEKQRVAIGRALVRRPRIFLMDEPLSNLDAKLRLQLKEEISSLQKKLNITMIYVTHDQSEAMTIGERIAIMQKGKIVQCGTARELYETPVNTFVANFFGNLPINLFKENDKLHGIRPEHILLSEERPVEEGREWKLGKIIKEEFQGSTRIYNLKIEEETVIAQTSTVEKLEVGSSVWICFNKEKIIMF